MLIEKSDGSGTYLGGPADVAMIVQIGERFHVCFLEEYPLPGQSQPVEELAVIKLKSKMHHTVGAATLEEAQAQLDDLRTKIELPDANIIRDRAIAMNDPVSVMFLPNWLADKRTVGEVWR